MDGIGRRGGRRESALFPIFHHRCFFFFLLRMPEENERSEERLSQRDAKKEIPSEVSGVGRVILRLAFPLRRFGSIAPKRGGFVPQRSPGAGEFLNTGDGGRTEGAEPSMRVTQKPLDPSDYLSVLPRQWGGRVGGNGSEEAEPRRESQPNLST